MKLYQLPLNLQQGIIHTNKEDVSNTVCAFYSRYKSLLVVRPEYRDLGGQIKKMVEDLYGGEYTLIYGGSFSIDTWDNRAANFGNTNPEPRTEEEIRNAVITAVDTFQDWYSDAESQSDKAYYSGMHGVAKDTLAYLKGERRTIHND